MKPMYTRQAYLKHETITGPPGWTCIIHQKMGVPPFLGFILFHLSSIMITI